MLVLNKSRLCLDFHSHIIPGVSVAGLVTNKELCRVVWGVFVHSVLHEYPFIVNELLLYV